MVNKYFTSQIEDIRVGYECECLWCCQEPRPWLPIIITKEDNMDTKSLPFGIEIVWRLENGEIRVPYLTKEQIEAEGWICKGCSGTTDQNGVETITGFCFKKGDFSLDLEKDYTLVIYNKSKYSYDFDDWGILYRGKCKDINTFRYICKLLGIND